MLPPVMPAVTNAIFAAAVQSEYSLFWRGPEAELLPTLEELIDPA